MLDIGVSKLAILGAIALVVIGPERLPGMARTLGTLLGRARAYVADVKAEVNRSMELDELRKMKDSVGGAVRDVEQTLRTGVHDFERSLQPEAAAAQDSVWPQYRPPHKRWRLKRGAMPQWYKARTGQRTKVLSGAARVARHRPTRNTG